MKHWHYFYKKKFHWSSVTDTDNPCLIIRHPTEPLPAIRQTRRLVSDNGKVVLKSIDKQFVAYLNLIIICKIIFLVQIFKPDAIVL